MKARLTFAFLIITLAFCSQIFAQSSQFSIDQSPLPPPTARVSDLANIIDDAVEAQIEAKLKAFEEKTNPKVEIAVVTVKTTGDRAIFDYSMAVARGWKIGSKDDDNPSALLMVAVDDRKYFTQVSKDLEDELPDGLVGQLQRTYLVPAFKEKNYTKGINDTIDAYLRTIEERKSGASATQTPTTQENKSRSMPSGCYVLICLVVIVIILIISFARGGGSGSGDGTGGSGRKRGPGGSRRSSGTRDSASDRDRWSSGGFGGNTSSGSAPIIFWGGGGSSSSSDWGSSSSDGDSWGGFGGGGDFGGGGAGGDW